MIGDDGTTAGVLVGSEEPWDGVRRGLAADADVP
jgi:hypothetical protein